MALSEIILPEIPSSPRKVTPGPVLEILRSLRKLRWRSRTVRMLPLVLAPMAPMPVTSARRTSFGRFTRGHIPCGTLQKTIGIRSVSLSVSLKKHLSLAIDARFGALLIFEGFGITFTVRKVKLGWLCLRIGRKQPILLL